jgi:hypothetical protein
MGVGNASLRHEGNTFVVESKKCHENAMNRLASIDAWRIKLALALGIYWHEGYPKDCDYEKIKMNGSF